MLLAHKLSQSTHGIDTRPQRHPKEPALRFGVTAFMTGWFLSGVGEVLMSRVIHSLLDNLSGTTLPLLKQSPLFAQGQQRLELAHHLALENESTGSHNEAIIKDYLQAAESRFADASTEVELSAMKAECFRYAALCAKLSGRPKSIIKDYATKALLHHKRGEQELKTLIKQPNRVMDILKVVSWPLSYPLIVSSMIIQNQPVTKLPEYTQRLLFPRHPEQTAIWQQIDTHQQSDLPTICEALINGNPINLKMHRD